jgi:hypothetical protein
MVDTPNARTEANRQIIRKAFEAWAARNRRD